ncbi:MAG: DUF1353 domain-containing protein [Terriglobia bacterium]
MSIHHKRFPVFLIAFAWATTCAAQGYGSFIGKVVTEWLDDGRKMKLLEPFAYIDPVGSKWDAPKGWIVDGASIPQIAWSVIGGPFEGPYRNASVIHDVACDQKQRPWRDVHRAFYTAMLAAGVDPIKAKIMYGAVYQFGPRWERQVRLTDIPIQSVESAIAQLRAAAAPGESVETQINPIPRRGCPEGLSCVSPMNLPPNQANVTAMFRPELPSVSGDTSAQFQKLKSFIESSTPSIEVIEDYRR